MPDPTSNPRGDRSLPIDGPPRPGVVWGGAALGVIAGASLPVVGNFDQDLGLMTYLAPLLLAGFGGGISAREVARAVGVSRGDRLILLTLGCAFPVWGVVSALLGVCVVSPLTCSMTWAALLTIVFRSAAWRPMLLLGGVSSLIGIVGLAVSDGLAGWSPRVSKEGVMVGLPIACWHLMHPLALRRIAWIHHANGLYALDHCEKCGYDIRGLPSPICPECGTSLIPPRRSL